MRNQRQIFFSLVLIFAGLVLLIGTVLDVDVWAICWPSGLILLGLWILLRPRLLGPDAALRMGLLGSVRRDGVWSVADEELWSFVGDIKLDLSQAEVPLGETRLRIFNFVSDITLRVPDGIGLALSSAAFFTEAKMLGKKREAFVTSVDLKSDNYETAERKVRLEVTCFVADVKVRPSP
jgi:hypothetical protein